MYNAVLRVRMCTRLFLFKTDAYPDVSNLCFKGCFFFACFTSFLLKEINNKMEKACGHTSKNPLLLCSEHHLDVQAREGHLMF